MYSYIETDENGIICACLESPVEAAEDQTELIQTDGYDPENQMGRYYKDGVIGPAAKENHYWSWNTETNSYDELEYPSS